MHFEICCFLRCSPLLVGNVTKPSGCLLLLSLKTKTTTTKKPWHRSGNTMTNIWRSWASVRWKRESRLLSLCACVCICKLPLRYECVPLQNLFQKRRWSLHNGLKPRPLSPRQRNNSIWRTNTGQGKQHRHKKKERERLLSLVFLYLHIHVFPQFIHILNTFSAPQQRNWSCVCVCGTRQRFHSKKIQQPEARCINQMTESML